MLTKGASQKNDPLELMKLNITDEIHVENYDEFLNQADLNVEAARPGEYADMVLKHTLNSFPL